MKEILAAKDFILFAPAMESAAHIHLYPPQVLVLLILRVVFLYLYRSESVHEQVELLSVNLVWSVCHKDQVGLIGFY